MSVVNIWVTEDGLLGLTERVGERVAWDAGDGGLGVGDDNAILDVESLNLAQGSGIGASVGDELSHDGEDRVGVDCLAWAVEVLVTLTVGVEVTSIGISDTGISVRGVSSSTGVAGAHALCGWVGRVRSESARDRVGFPDIHLSTARAVASDTSVYVVRRWNPSLNVGLNGMLVQLLVQWLPTQKHTMPLMNLRSRGH